MNGFLLLLPFLLIRFGLLFALGKSGIKRAAHFPAMLGKEKSAYWAYQLSNAAIFVYLCFLTVKINFSWQFYSGLACYVAGLILCAVSIFNFARPSTSGLNTNGLYRLSRNPMYLSYFLCFMGCAFLTRSQLLGATVLIFQLSSHWVILSEERWCVERFGEAFTQYMKKVRRYI